jgi:hypothetical protein
MILSSLDSAWAENIFPFISSSCIWSSLDYYRKRTIIESTRKDR